MPNKKGDYSHILLIDFAEVGQHLVPILENQFKCYATVVTSKEEILQVLQKQPPDLIMILDKKTGELGPSLGRYIRELEKTNGLKTTAIVTLLSQKTYLKAQTIDTSDIEKYHFISQTEHGLQEILSQNLLMHAKEEAVEFDRSALESILSLNSADCADLLTESIQLFVGQYDEKIKEIKVSWDKKDLDQLKESAHFMKSSSFTMGANKLAQLFGEMEMQQFKDEEAFKAKLQDIDTHFLKAKNKLLHFANETKFH